MGTIDQKVYIEIIKIIPDLLWVLLALVIFIYSYRLIKKTLLPNVTNISAFGIKINMLKESIDSIYDIAQKDKMWDVSISELDKDIVLKRTNRNLNLFKNLSILWFDDRPDTLKNEIKMFRQLGGKIEITTTLEKTISMLKTNNFDLMISDIDRSNGEEDGVSTLKQLYKNKTYVPTIFYIGDVNEELGIPPHAFGLTNRPDELLHLVIDILERKNS